MRRASLSVLALAALAAGLAACTVDVEGAACKEVGTVDNCPSGQACGTDLKCSVKAAGCQPCKVGTVSCQGGRDVMTCTAEGDPSCGTWKVAAGGNCTTGGLQWCRIPKAGGDPVCACEQWTVLPGIASGTCNRPSITSAIAEAVKFEGTAVKLGGVAPATYGNELDDAAPIVIAPGVILVGDETSPVAVPTNQVIAVRGHGPAGLDIQLGASVRGVTVQRADAAGPTVGVLVSGGIPTSPGGASTLFAVQVDAQGAGGAFTTGVRIAGTNTISMSRLELRGATGAGLEVDRDVPGQEAWVADSVFDGNHVGVSLLKGDLRLLRSTVKRSAWEGFVSATGTPGLTRFSIQDSLISGNGRGGVRLSVNDYVEFLRTRICGNTGYARSYSGVTRTVGGVLVVGNPPGTLAFRGNVIHDNGGDQVYVAASSAVWDLSGATGCAATDRNVFANYTSPGVGVAAVGASVSALFNSWAQAFPAVGTDYFANPTSPVGAVDAGTGSGATDFCGAAAPADLTCPAP